MHKIDEFKYIGIKHLKIDNTISEMSAKKDLNTLNKIKNAGMIKQQKKNSHTPKQKELHLFHDLSDTFLTDKTMKSESQKDITLMSSKNEKEK